GADPPLRTRAGGGRAPRRGRPRGALSSVRAPPRAQGDRPLLLPGARARKAGLSRLPPGCIRGRAPHAGRPARARVGAGAPGRPRPGDRVIRRAMVLAAGRGTRLAPLTDRTPQPLGAVAGRPFLGHRLAVLAARWICA